MVGSRTLPRAQGHRTGKDLVRVVRPGGYQKIQVLARIVNFVPIVQALEARRHNQRNTDFQSSPRSQNPWKARVCFNEVPVFD